MKACPYCAQRAMSLIRKCFLSPDVSVSCASCGKRVGVPWGAVAAAAPVAVGIIAAIRLEAPWNAFGALAGVAVYVAIQQWLVPVQGREAGQTGS